MFFNSALSGPCNRLYQSKHSIHVSLLFLNFILNKYSDLFPSYIKINFNTSGIVPIFHFLWVFFWCLPSIIFASCRFYLYRFFPFLCVFPWSFLLSSLLRQCHDVTESWKGAVINCCGKSTMKGKLLSKVRICPLTRPFVRWLIRPHPPLWKLPFRFHVGREIEILFSFLLSRYDSKFYPLSALAA